MKIVVLAASVLLVDAGPGGLRQQNEDSPADTFPDDTTGFDDDGPYTEVPTPHQEANPLPVKPGWENETGLKAATSWGRSFCMSHHVGTFCNRFTQVRCCRNHWGFVKCGTIVHSNRCGWRGGGGGWHVHSGCDFGILYFAPSSTITTHQHPGF